MITILSAAVSTVTAVWAADKPVPSADDKAAVAVEAYDKADVKLVENWFGCPPVVEGDPLPAERAAVKNHCEPVTKTRGTGNGGRVTHRVKFTEPRKNAMPAVMTIA